MLILPWGYQQLKAVFSVISFTLFFLLPFWGMNSREEDMGTESLSLCCRLWLFCPKHESEHSQLVSALFNPHEINCRYTWFTLKLVRPFNVLHVHTVFLWRSSAPGEGKELQKAILPPSRHFCSVNMAQGHPNKTKKQANNFICKTLQDLYGASVFLRVYSTISSIDCGAEVH